MKRLLLVLVLLLCAASAAHAQTERLATHPENALSQVSHWPFVSGVRVQGELTAAFVLADSGDFNGLYFEMLRGEDEHWETTGMRGGKCYYASERVISPVTGKLCAANGQRFNIAYTENLKTEARKPQSL